MEVPAPARLPSDILLLVFSFVPLRARLTVLRRVCQRWNKIAPRSVRALPENVPTHLLGQFVNTTTWRFPRRILKNDVSASTAAAAVEPWIGKLLSLNIVGVELNHPILLSISRLTSLTMTAPSHCSPKTFDQFIASNSCSLVALKFCHGYKSVFPDVSLPCLESLVIPGGDAFVRTFLQTHMAKLTKLEVGFVSKMDIFSAPAPKLRTLILSGSVQLDDVHFQSWYQGLSSLQEASLQLNGPISQLALFKPQTITALSIEHPSSFALADQAIQTLKLCPHLRSISFPVEASLKKRHFQEIQSHILSAIGSQLDSISGVILTPERLLFYCPMLTSLTLKHVSLPPDYLLSLRYPHLRKLVVDTSQSSSPGVTSECLPHVLTEMPTLRIVELCLQNNSSIMVKIDSRQLEESLLIAEHNGMEQITVSLSRPYPVPSEFLQVWTRMQAKLRWLCMFSVITDLSIYNSTISEA